MVIPVDQWRSHQTCEAVIELNEPPPLLVVEVVSATKTVDYRAKRAKYDVLSVPEYWIVDPLISRVIVLTLIEGWYEGVEFKGLDQIESPTFPELELTAQQVLRSEI